MNIEEVCTLLLVLTGKKHNLTIQKCNRLHGLFGMNPKKSVTQVLFHFLKWIKKKEGLLEEKLLCREGQNYEVYLHHFNSYIYLTIMTAF